MTPLDAPRPVQVRNAVSRWPDDLAKLCLASFQQQAARYLESVSIIDLTELKSLNNPPAGVKDVFECAIYLLADSPGRIESLNVQFRAGGDMWGPSKKALMYPARFLRALRGVRLDTRPRHLARAMSFVANQGLTVSSIRRVSKAAAGVFAWCAPGAREP